MLREQWQIIRDEIAEDITKGSILSGEKLPTEPELCQKFGVGRHSVRRAIDALAVEGKLRVEHGRGIFVEDAPLIDYNIGRRARFRQNLRSQGVVPGGSVIGYELCPASPVVAKALQLAEGTLVHCLFSQGMADGVPICLGYSYHDAARFADLPGLRQKNVPITDVYRHYGIQDYFRLTTSIYARRAEKDEAQMLRQHAAQPVLVVCKTDSDSARRPIAYSEGIWASDRVKFTFEEREEGQ